MKTRTTPTPTRYTISESRRQQALDMARAKPGVTGAEIINRFQWEPGTANSMLKGMCDMGELRREPISVQRPDLNGRRVTSKTYAYTALVEKTISAEAVRQKTDAERKPYKPRDKPQTQRQVAQNMAKETKKPWITRNICPDRPPLKDQGGQGAVQRRVVIGSVMG